MKNRVGTKEDVQAKLAAMNGAAPDLRGGAAPVGSGLFSANSLNSSFVTQPTLPDTALHGVVGDIVRRIEPHTETHPAAVLVQLLVGLGNLIGRSPYVVVERDMHHVNLFAVVVGRSAVARKGTSWGHARHFLEAIDPAWASSRVMGGLASGEGVIVELRDPDEGDEENAGRKNLDKRLLLLESEFGSVLRSLQRDGNTLSAILRNAWDTGTLRNLANAHRGKSGQSLRASDCHISIIGHVTRQELVKLMSGNDAANGFANRFLWAFSERTKLLPEGGDLHRENFDSAIASLRSAVQSARRRGEVKRSDAARDLWREIYSSLAEERPGRWGDVTSRAEAQVLRLGLLYALLDGSAVIDVPHLEAARGLWDYCCASAKWAFGERLYSRNAEKILDGLREFGRLTLSEIHGKIFNRNLTGAEVEGAIREIEKLLVVTEKETGGKAAKCYELRK